MSPMIRCAWAALCLSIAALISLPAQAEDVARQLPRPVQDAMRVIGRGDAPRGIAMLEAESQRGDGYAELVLGFYYLHIKRGGDLDESFRLALKWCAKASSRGGAVGQGGDECLGDLSRISGQSPDHLRKIAGGDELLEKLAKLRLRQRNVDDPLGAYLGAKVFHGMTDHTFESPFVPH
ncbi:MAG: hypothetical protein P4M05_21135 [Bradyrhizobium sp.]|nr:hypothetical protein [Bradyrhizobium sp.]